MTKKLNNKEDGDRYTNETITLLVDYEVSYEKGNKECRDRAIEVAIKETPYKLGGCGKAGSYRLERKGASLYEPTPPEETRDTKSPEEGYPNITEMVSRHEELLCKATDVYNAEVQAIANKHGVMIATGQMSDFWQVKKPRSNRWFREAIDNHPALDDLKALDTIAIEMRIGPANMMMFRPVKVK